MVAIFITSAATHEIPGCVETSTNARTANVSGAIAVFSLIRDNLSNYPHLLIRTKGKNVSLWMEIWNGYRVKCVEAFVAIIHCGSCAKHVLGMPAFCAARRQNHSAGIAPLPSARLGHAEL